ncbi:hypothetical protein IC582_004950 [Cucumis melo]
MIFKIKFVKLKGPCQPRNYTFPFKKFGAKSRQFNPAWFKEYPNWLEYSISKDAAFCLCCYLFKPEVSEESGRESFVSEEFSNWKKKERLETHVGGPNSAHNQACGKCASIDCTRFLLRQGLAFRAHDESDDSKNQGNFLELLRWLCNHNKDIEVATLKNALNNLKLIAPDIQKDIVN